MDKQIKDLDLKNLELNDFFVTQSAIADAGKNTILQLKQLFGLPTYSNFQQIFQQNTDAPQFSGTLFVDDFVNNFVSSTHPDFRDIAFARIGVGDYSVSIISNMSNTIDNNRVDLSFSDAKCRVTGKSNTAAGPTRSAIFYFSSYNAAGTKADGVISFTNMYIRIY